jgi:hypothetical protein
MIQAILRALFGRLIEITVDGTRSDPCVTVCLSGGLLRLAVNLTPGECDRLARALEFTAAAARRLPRTRVAA